MQQRLANHTYCCLLRSCISLKSSVIQWSADVECLLVQSRTAPPTGGEEWREDIGEYMVRYVCFIAFAFINR